jgi:hypothetical protein
MARTSDRSSATTQYHPTYQFTSHILFDEYYDALLSHFKKIKALIRLDVKVLSDQQRRDLWYRIKAVLEHDLGQTYDGLTNAFKSLMTEIVDYVAMNTHNRLELMAARDRQIILAITNEEKKQTLEDLSKYEKKWMRVHVAFVETSLDAEVKLLEIEHYFAVEEKPDPQPGVKVPEAQAEDAWRAWYGSQSPDDFEGVGLVQEKQVHRDDIGLPRTPPIVDFNAEAQPIFNKIEEECREKTHIEKKYEEERKEKKHNKKRNQKQKQREEKQRQEMQREKMQREKMQREKMKGRRCKRRISQERTGKGRRCKGGDAKGGDAKGEEAKGKEES